MNLGELPLYNHIRTRAQSIKTRAGYVPPLPSYDEALEIIAEEEKRQREEAQRIGKVLEAAIPHARAFGQ